MGVLVNVIFLIGFCFVILLEVIECFIELYEMQQLLVVFGVGVVGLLVNVLGFCFFYYYSGFSQDFGYGYLYGGYGYGYGFFKGFCVKSICFGSSDINVVLGEQGFDQEEINILVVNISNFNGLKLDFVDLENFRSGDIVEV